MKTKCLVVAAFLLIVGCSEKENSYKTTGSSLSSSSVSKVQEEDMAKYMEITNVSVRKTGNYYILGEIRNTSSKAIDEIGDLAIYDAAGNLIRVKSIHVKMSAGGTMPFEELVGQEFKPASVKLSGL